MAQTTEKQQVQSSRPERTPDQEARRQAYLERLRRSTEVLTERVRQSERLTAEDFSIQINATGF